MADLPHTICFRASTRMLDELLERVERDRRKLADVVRLLVEHALESERKGTI